MSEFKWSDEQEKVIDSINSNTLVSASAGSGKTAVMIERLIRIILNHTSVLEVVMVTFNNSVAQELRLKVAKALKKALEETSIETEKEYLRDQLEMIPMANISTMHALCGNIIRENFEVVGIDPSFGIIDDESQAILFDNAVNDVLEEYETTYNKNFEMLYKYLTKLEFKNTIKTLYGVIVAQPDREAFFDHIIKDSQIYDLNQKPIILTYFKIIKDKIDEIEHLFLDICEEITNSDSGINKIKFIDEHATKCLDFISDLKQSINFEELISVAKSIVYPDNPSLVRKDTDPERLRLKNKYHNISNFLKETIKEIKKYGDVSFNQQCDNAQAMAPFIELCCDFLKKVIDRYREYKLKDNMLDFNDLEYYAVSILKHDDIAEEYRDKFKYVCVDEYQDINAVQEFILSKISNGKNLFMVGDSKQSIYNFRQSDTSIFLGKKEKYTNDNSLGEALYLNKNFRSQKEILEFANRIFDVVMTKDFGGVDYKEEARLTYGRTDYDQGELYLKQFIENIRKELLKKYLDIDVEKIAQKLFGSDLDKYLKIVNDFIDNVIYYSLNKESKYSFFNLIGISILGKDIFDQNEDYIKNLIKHIYSVILTKDFNRIDKTYLLEIFDEKNYAQPNSIRLIFLDNIIKELSKNLGKFEYQELIENCFKTNNIDKDLFNQYLIEIVLDKDNKDIVLEDKIIIAKSIFNTFYDQYIEEFNQLNTGIINDIIIKSYFNKDAEISANMMFNCKETIVVDFIQKLYDYSLQYTYKNNFDHIITLLKTVSNEDELDAKVEIYANDLYIKLESDSSFKAIINDNENNVFSLVKDFANNYDEDEAENESDAPSLLDYTKEEYDIKEFRETIKEELLSFIEDIYYIESLQPEYDNHAGFIGNVISKCINEKNVNVISGLSSSLQPSDNDQDDFCAMFKDGVYSIEEDVRKNEEKDNKLNALYIIKKIKELVGKKIICVIEDKEAKLKIVEYKDITILAQTRSVAAPVLRALKQYDIPADTAIMETDTSSLEVNLLIDILKVIDNPEQDYPLVSTMTSFMGNFTMTELVEIRKQCKSAIDKIYKEREDKSQKNIYYYEYVFEMAKGTNELAIKTKAFLDKLGKYRIVASFSTVSDLLKRIIYENEFNEIILMKDEGKERLLALNGYIDSLKGKYYNNSLPEFIRFVDENPIIKKTSQSLSGSENMINMSTLHQSKGLEYPIVFFIGLDSSFGKQGEKGDKFVIDKDYGMVMKSLDTDLLSYTKDLPYIAMKKYKEFKEHEEKMRLMYVGITRAQNLLYMVNVNQGKSNMFGTKECGSYASWIEYAASKDESFIDDYYVNEYIEIDDLDKKQVSVVYSKPKDIDKDAFLENLQLDYKFKDSMKLNIMHTVTSINKKNYNEMREIGDLNYVHDKSDGTKVEIGTAMHRALQLIDFDIDNIEDVTRAINDMVENDLISQEERDLIDDNLILKCLSSPVINIAKTNNHYRERMFILNICGSDLFNDINTKDKVLLEGVIDLLIETSKGYIVVDYKHTQKSDSILKKTYQTQLDLYASAIETITKKPVLEKYILVIDDARLIKLD